MNGSLQYSYNYNYLLQMCQVCNFKFQDGFGIVLENFQEGSKAALCGSMRDLEGFSWD